MLFTLLLLSCASPSDEPRVSPGCGDGVVAPDEECDDGEGNSDTEPDACRARCLLPVCGDGVTDQGEACDDGDAWGGDGCTPRCQAEDGQLEIEPNDAWDAPNASEGGAIHGALQEGDVDCFAVDLASCSSLSARLSGECPAPATLALHDPSGAVVATGGPADDGCAVLDPEDAPGARFVEGGDWTVCVAGLLDGAVPFYTLDLSVIDPEDASYPLAEADDLDGDGRPGACDDDDDGDGVLDEDDNCPEVPNGLGMAPLAPDDEGFIRTWLTAGPYTGADTTEDCRPSDDSLVAEDDATAQPSLGDPAGDTTWVAFWSGEERLDFLDDYGDVDAPREVYHAVYLYTAAPRTLTLALGPDDGARAWLDAVEVLDISSCQGTVIDQFTAEVELAGGWHGLLIKVRDQGGGWGDYVRFKEGGEAVTDLELSLSPGGPWRDDQGDLDGDGVGDVCDPTPVGG